MRHNSETLEKSLEHIIYEMKMYFDSYRTITDKSKSILLEDKIVQNALLESHFVHLRSLITFFKATCETNSNNSDSYKDDVFYTDYIISKESKNSYFILKSYFEGNREVIVKDCINKTIFHISTNRCLDEIKNDQINIANFFYHGSIHNKRTMLNNIHDFLLDIDTKGYTNEKTAGQEIRKILNDTLFSNVVNTNRTHVNEELTVQVTVQTGSTHNTN
jgi:hypothetical protein